MESKNVKVDSKLLKGIKILAIKEDKTIKGKIGELLKKELKKKGELIE